MSCRLSLPLNQQRHSNVAVVRFKSKAAFRVQKFEIACYKNKVLAFRSGEETDLTEVLQIERVFTDVGKGEYANKKLLKLHFGTLICGEDKADEVTEKQCLEFILRHGEVQIAELERSAEANKLWNTIAHFVSQHAVHPVTKRRYAVAIVESAMKDVGFNPRLDVASKPQALQLIKQIHTAQVLPIVRAQMRLRVWGPSESVRSTLASIAPDPLIIIESEGPATEGFFEVLIEASLYRQVEMAVRGISGGSSMILAQVVAAEGDAAVGDAMIMGEHESGDDEDGSDVEGTVNSCDGDDGNVKLVGRWQPAEQDEAAAAPAPKKQQQQHGNNSKKKNKKGTRKSADSDDDDGKGGSLAAHTQQLAIVDPLLEAQRAKEKDDSDDGGNNKRGKKKSKANKHPPKPTPKKKVNDDDGNNNNNNNNSDMEEEEEELCGAKKLKRQMRQKQQHRNNNQDSDNDSQEEEDIDYGTDGEEDFYKS
eukprot:PhM_4_TR9408/c0_g1_i1/m.993/K14574/SDO1, SBDS; ribosome maturation protein SDO1